LDDIGGYLRMNAEPGKREFPADLLAHGPALGES